MAASSKATTKVAPAAKKKAAPAKKAAPLKKGAPAKKAPAKAASAKKAPVKAPAKKAPVAKKAPAKAPAKKAPVKEAPAAKKAPVKKATPAAKPASRVASPPKLPASVGTREVKKAPPKRKGPLDKFLLGQVEALNSERITYNHQAKALKAEADLLVAEREPGDVQFDEESGEGDTLAVERERDLALSAQAQAAVEEIDLALEKIKEGTYGVCEQCHNTIPKERLKALPYAALCVQCKSAGFARR
jgi:RNA polymerase-binding transcription factor DksA